MVKSCFNGAGPVAAASRQGSKRCCQQRVEELLVANLHIYGVTVVVSFQFENSFLEGEAKKTDCTSVTICGFLHLSSCFSKLF